ncbi:MAG: alkyl hydroperoxide reductase [Mameliella sp.]|nr:alkyl hydroperoxide reductase [Mameliella sp.]|tara:strand:+ start:242 stop:781 length:540 start_codon:yes stop_codon:yes gene_type:complete
MLLPRRKVPELDLPLVDGSRFSLSGENAKRGTLVTIYRGLHCPVCIRYLKDLDRLTPAFAERGVSTIALSSDDADRAQGMADKVEPDHLRIAYDFSLEAAKDWGLWFSRGREGKSSTGVEEPAVFPEPGLFLINPDGTLYFASVQTMPFARPAFDEVLKAVDFVIDRDYPARGEHVFQS